MDATDLLLPDHRTRVRQAGGDGVGTDVLVARSIRRLVDRPHRRAVREGLRGGHCFICRGHGRADCIQIGLFWLSSSKHVLCEGVRQPCGSSPRGTELFRRFRDVQSRLPLVHPDGHSAAGRGDSPLACRGRLDGRPPADCQSDLRARHAARLLGRADPGGRRLFRVVQDVPAGMAARGDSGRALRRVIVRAAAAPVASRPGAFLWRDGVDCRSRVDALAGIAAPQLSIAFRARRRMEHATTRDEHRAGHEGNLSRRRHPPRYCCR
jgi:hypothetical protein